MVPPEISTVLESVAAAQHDGILAFGCIILEVDIGERGSPSFISSRIYILLCDGLGLGLGLGRVKVRVRVRVRDRVRVRRLD